MDQSSTDFFAGTREELLWGPIAVDHVSIRFWISAVVPEIFAIKVESCQKTRKILDDFLPSQFFGGGHCKNCAQVITPASRDVD